MVAFLIFMKKLCNFASVKKGKNYIAIFLVLAFAWAILPAHTIHHWFADHEDTADNYCLTHHSHLGIHIEERHTHCEILQFDSPVYNAPVLVQLNTPNAFLMESYLSSYEDIPHAYSYCNLPSRAPPVIS